MIADVLLKDQTGAVLTLTINRPHAHNAMGVAEHLALSEALDDAADNPSVRVIVLTGAGDRAFSAGRDLKELAAQESMSADEKARVERCWDAVTRLTDRFDYPKPIIAKVNGLALGGGFEIALACDIIVASAAAEFAMPEVRRGLIPIAGGVHRLPRMIPYKTAIGFMLSGRRMSADRAYELGLVNEVAEPDKLDDVVSGWVDDILAGAPLSLASIKQCAAQGSHRPLSVAMAETYSMEEQRKASSDAVEGARAFTEKRPPVWSSE